MDHMRYSGFWVVTYFPRLPISSMRGEKQWRCGVRPQLQRRDRAGIAPASLHVLRFYVWVTIGGKVYLCQANERLTKKRIKEIFTMPHIHMLLNMVYPAVEGLI